MAFLISISREHSILIFMLPSTGGPPPRPVYPDLQSQSVKTGVDTKVNDTFE